MQIYACPDECPAPKPDFAKFDWKLNKQHEAEHQAMLKTWLVSKGYKGKNTGEIVSFPVGDGSAKYMLADGPKSCLIHLPYMDAYHYPNAKFLPKTEIVRLIESSKKINAIFDAGLKSKS